MRVTLLVALAALVAQDVEAGMLPGAKGFGLIKNGLFKPAPFSMCPNSNHKQEGDDRAPDLALDPAVQADLPAVPTDAPSDSEQERQRKNRARHAFTTMRLVQFYCANDVVNVCGLAVDNRPNCAGKVIETCASCFNPEKATANKTCVCECERKNTAALGSCFRPHDAPGNATDGGKYLRALLEVEDSESNHDQGGKRPADDKDSCGEVAGAMRAIRDCFKANFTQLSDPCKKALHRRHKDDLAEKNGTTPTQPPATDAPATSAAPTQQGTARRVLAADDVPTVATVTSPLDVAAGSFDSPVSSSTPAGGATGGATGGANAAVIGGAVAGAVVLIAAVVVLNKRRASAADSTVTTVQ
jgi:hypothetical protein